MISKEELDSILVNLEEDRIEKTISISKEEKFGEALCAFSNDFPKHQKPGYLIVGVNNDGSRSGLKEDEQLLQTLMAYRTDGRIVPPPIITVAGFKYDDGYVVVAEVIPSFQPPVRFKGRVYIRIGPRKDIANEAEERILSEKRSSFAKTFDTMPCYESKLEELSIDIFKSSYLPTAIAPDILEANHRELRQQLTSLKFYDLKADCPTNSGIIMFGKNPRFFIPGAYVQYVRFKGNSEVSDFEFEHRFEGDMFTQMKVMSDFIKSQIVKKVQLKLGEEYKINYPVLAIQELLYNAVIHRDYQSNAPIKFYEFSDRVEIINPGGLYGDARPENFPNKNDYRNPSLAEVAKNAGFINAFNVGVKRSIAALKSNGNPDPIFIKDQTTSFGVIIYR